MIVLSRIPVDVLGGTFGSTPINVLDLSLFVVAGGDENVTPENDLDLSLDVENIDHPSLLENNVDLNLEATVDLDHAYESENIGLTLDFSVGSGDWRVLWVWTPTDPVKYTGTNYTYDGSVTKLGIAQEAHLVIAFEGTPITEKDSNSTGQFVFWAVVGIEGLHTWTVSIYQGGVFQVTIYKDEFYEGEGPPDPPDPGDPPLIDLPTEPGGLFVVFDYLPVMVVFGLFGFIGMLIVGRIGVLFGGVAALLLTTAMGTLPSWIVYFLILVTIVVTVYKLKMGGSKVEVAGGGGA